MKKGRFSEEQMVGMLREADRSSPADPTLVDLELIVVSVVVVAFDHSLARPFAFEIHLAPVLKLKRTRDIAAAGIGINGATHVPVVPQPTHIVRISSTTTTSTYITIPV